MKHMIGTTTSALRRAVALCMVLICLCGCALPLLTSCEEISGKVTTLYVYNWGEYISDGSEDSLDSNAAFEEWYYETFGEHVRVNYSTFSSNEDMYAKLASGSVSYDVVVPSDYMIQRLIAEGLVQKLDHENIPNLANLHGDFYGENAKFDYYDKGCLYSVPYMYGMVGIIYNTTMVDPDDPNIGSWNLLWDERNAGNILQFNNSRDAFGSAQYLLGLDVNSDSEADWRQALEKLKEQKRVVQGYVMDEIYNKMENGSAAIASYYAGDFMTMYEENEDLEFYYPSEGTNLYVDAMCIPTSAKNKLIAERYIDFMLTEEPAVANAEYTYYGSPNRLVRENEEYIEYMNSIKDGGFDLMYDTDNVHATAYENLTPEKLALLNQLWEELKSDIGISTGIYVICGVIIAVMAGFGVCFAVRRKIRNIY